MKSLRRTTGLSILILVFGIPHHPNRFLVVGSVFRNLTYRGGTRNRSTNRVVKILRVHRVTTELSRGPSFRGRMTPVATTMTA